MDLLVLRTKREAALFVICNLFLRHLQQLEVCLEQATRNLAGGQSWDHSDAFYSPGKSAQTWPNYKLQRSVFVHVAPGVRPHATSWGGQCLFGASRSV